MEKVIVSVADLVNAAGLYKANRAGIYGGANMEAEQIGVMGGLSTDLYEAEVLYKNNEITRNEYEDRLTDNLETGAKTLIGIAIEKSLDFVEEVVSNYIPIARPVVKTVRRYVEQYVMNIADKVVEGAKSIFNWVRKKISL